ncbi:MAG: hypothetical protein Q7R78_00795 [bacterium]|nr:hypothetical protein [bacterium]
MKTSKKVEIATVATAATALVGAGLYFFLGSKEAKKHRKDVTTWMKKAEKEVASKVKKLKKETFNEANYKKIVAEVSKKYKGLQKLEESEVKQFATVLGKAWKTLKQNAVKK